MQKFPLVIDLETKHTFREFDEPKKLGITVAGIYDYSDRKSYIYREEHIVKLFPKLEKASYIIGYNSRSFDLAVLQAYYPGDVTLLSQFDILEDIKRIIGKRIGLNDVAYATLNEKKTGHGLMAINYYKEGRMDELEKYCLSDVMITKKLFDYGVEHGEIFYMNSVGKSRIKVNWKPYMEDPGAKDTALTLPF